MAQWNTAAMQRGLTLLVALALSALPAACARSSSSGSGTAGDSTDADPPPGTNPTVEVVVDDFVLAPAFPALTFSKPVVMVQAPGDDSAWYLVEQGGLVWRFANDPDTATMTEVADFTALADTGPFEAGLLGMAFHPDFAANGQVFFSYTAPATEGALTSHLSRFAWDAGTDTVDMASEQVLLEVSQPYGNHNGGNIAFGPDGFLYLGLGDGGSGGDPHGNGQNTDTLLGAMLRMDVDGGTPYAIPADNPFAGGGGRPEIYAWGFRNPWRWSFDMESGGLWVGDVGQAEREEVDWVVRGGNYGWDVREGTTCYAQATCDATGFSDPVTEYTHDEGCSITGGYVYRGSAIPELDGAYLFGDYCSGTLWARIEDTGAGQGLTLKFVNDLGLAIAAFAQDHAGEVYVLDIGGGQVHRLVSAGDGS